MYHGITASSRAMMEAMKIANILNAKDYDVVLYCGPEVMMKEVIKICKGCNTKMYVSMKKHMACGVGACLVCTCSIGFQNPGIDYFIEHELKNMKKLRQEKR